MITATRATADALDAKIWKRLALEVHRAADHAIAAVLRVRTGSAPRSARARRERLGQLAEAETDKTLTKFCASAYNTLYFRHEAVDRGSLAPWWIQEGIRDVEDVLLPLAKRLCSRTRRRNAVAGA